MEIFIPIQRQDKDKNWNNYIWTNVSIQIIIRNNMFKCDIWDTESWTNMDVYTLPTKVIKLLGLIKIYSGTDKLTPWLLIL